MKLQQLRYVLEITRHGNHLSAAAQALNTSQPGVSRQIQLLEEELGFSIFVRTRNRIIGVTPPGEHVIDIARRVIDDIGALRSLRDQASASDRGTLTIGTTHTQAKYMLPRVIAGFVERYPEVTIDISVSNRLIDVIGSGFDAGIRYGGTVPEDMIAQRLSPDLRWMAAAAPAYLDRFGAPATPQDLRHHRCIGIRLGNDQHYHWEFERGAEVVAIATPGPLTVDASVAALALGLNGTGILYASQAVLQPHLDSGALRPVLADWSPMGSGFHLYYSGRRNLATGLRLLIDLIREHRPLSG